MSVTLIELPSGYEDGSFTPAFDKTGASTANRVPNELQTFSANAEGVTQFFIPSYAPFFANLLSVVYVNAQGVETPLQAGADYVYAFPFIGASRSIGMACFGGIVLLNEGISGQLKLSYQTLGGSWMVGVTASQEAGNHSGIDPYWTSWDKAANYGTEFPIIDHDWDKTDATGLPDVLASVDAFSSGFYAQLIQDQVTDQAALDHVLATGTPHGETKETINLGNVQNYPAATDAQAAQTNNSLTYISAGQLKTAFLAAVPPASETAYGMVKMNRGDQVGDGTDSSKALTAAGFIKLVKDRSTPISDVFNKAQIEVRLPGWPIVFPCMWQGNTYTTLAGLINAISSSVGVSPIEYSSQQGKLWFPTGTTVPDLTTTPV